MLENMHGQVLQPSVWWKHMQVGVRVWPQHKLEKKGVGCCGGVFGPPALARQGLLAVLVMDE